MQAVLTGDVVGSSALSPDAHRKVIGLIRTLPRVFPDAVAGPVDVFSGDSWQLLFSDASCSIRAALYLRAILKREKALAVDSRVSIAWGDVDLNEVNLERISESTGALFTVSGRGLKELDQPFCFCFSSTEMNPVMKALDSAVRLLDVLVRQWSAEQARAVSLSLLGRTQADMAAEFGISQPSVHKSLQAAHWSEIEAVLGRLELIDNIAQYGYKYKI